MRTPQAENTPGGYTELLAWAAKHNKEKQPVLFVMEATGVYYYKVLRDYCRELLALKKDRQRAKSQLHAMNASYRKHPQVVALKQSQIDFCESAMETIQKDLKRLVGQDTALKDKIEQLASIPGIGFETALILA